MARRPSLFTQVSELLAKLEPEMEAAFRAVIAEVVSRATIREIVAALEANDIERAVAAVGLDPVAFSPVVEIYRQGYVQSGTASAAYISKRSGATYRFDVRSPRSEEFLRVQSSRLVTEMTEDPRKALRETLSEGMFGGRNPNSVALDVVGRINRVTGQRQGGIVGLTSRQAEYVRDVRRALSDPETMSEYLDRADSMRDRRFDRTVAKAIREGRKLDPTTVNKIVNAYSSNHLRLRGQTIAQTEMQEAFASSEAQAFDQAIADGVVSPEVITVTWRTAADARVRDTHRNLNGNSVKQGERFSNQMRYPHDPEGPARERIRCRCRAERSIDFLAGIQ
jgi:hypothetical protein